MRYAIRRLTPRPLRHFLYRLGQFFGNEFRQVQQFGDADFPSVEGALSYLKEWGFRPGLVIDVGAFRGEWTRMVKGIFPDTSVLMVEAQRSTEQSLRDVCGYYDGVDYSIALLGPQDGLTVSFTEMLTGSSVFEEKSDVPRERAIRQTVTLDTLLDGKKPDLLKLDVQGYELEVLKGASDALTTAQFVLMETSLIQINRGCPLFSEVIAFMNGANFRLLDFCSQIRRKDKALWQTDLLFISNASPFLPVAELNSINW